MTERKRRARFFVMNIIRLMLIFALVGSYFNHRWLVLVVSALALSVTFLPWLLHRKFGINFPADLEIMIILFIYGSLFFGEVRGFYARFWWWDGLLNLLAASALGIVGFTILYVLYRDEQIDASPEIIALFTFCFAFAIGTLWEFFEFFLDSSLGFSLQKASLQDTMFDLIANAVGSLLASVAGYSYLKKGKTNIISKLIVNFIEKNPILFRSKKPETEEEKINKIINKGETEKIEFKSTLRTNIHTNDFDRKIEHSVLKTISAFLNSEGGTILIGVKDNKEIIVIEKDNFQTYDKFYLHLTNLIKNSIGKEFFQIIKIEKASIENKTVISIFCEKSDRPVFLKFGQEEFFIRNGPSSVKLEGSSLVDYVNHRFKKG